MEKILLSEDFRRMQKLAGIQQPVYDNEYNEVIEILAEVYLYEHYYSKGILKENLNKKIIFEVKGKISNFINKVKEKLTDLSNPEVYSTILLAKIKNLVDEKTYNQFIKLYKNYKGSSNSEEIKKYLQQQEEIKESIFNLFRGKKGQPNTASKLVVGLMIGLISLGAINKNINKSDIINNVDGVEQVNNDSKDSPVDDKTYDATKKFVDGAKEELNISDKATNTLDTELEKIQPEPTSDSPNPVTVSDDGKTVSTGFNIGAYELENEDKTAENIAAKIADQVPDGKQVTGGTIEPIGAISDTPGSDANDNTANDGSKDLKEKRLETAKKLWPKVLKFLKDKYKDKFPENTDIKLSDGTTKVGGKAGKEGDPKIQTLQYDTSDLTTEDIPDTTPDTPPDDTDTGDDNTNVIPPDDAKTFLRNEKLVVPDGNKYYTILGFILPNIIDDKSYDSFIKTLALKQGDVINDNFINKKIENLSSKTPQTEEIKNTIKTLEWARGVKKSPSSLINNFKKLDNKVNLSRQKTIALKPGEKGKALSQPGSGTSQNTGFASDTIAEQLILELQTDFEELPGYNATKAKNNLGLLVPVYISVWPISDIKGDKSTLDYITNTYKSTYDIFANKFPKFKEKISQNIMALDKTASAKKSTTTSFDNLQNKTQTQTDADRLTKAVEKDGSFKSYLSKIDNVDELANFILALFLYRDTKGDPLATDKDFAGDTDKVRSTLFKLNNRISIKEGDVDPIFSKFPDVKTAFTHIGRSSTLRNLLKSVNTQEEFIQVILRGILPHINEKFKQKKNISQLKDAIARAANLSSKYKGILDKKYKKTLEEKSLNESFLRMQKLAGIIKE